MNFPRIQRLIESAIDIFQLDLRGICVLTEAATGFFMLTPFIAALGGAKHVYALTRDSRFGFAREVGLHVEKLARAWGCATRITVLYERNDPRIGSADIVTNLGFVRPLNKEFLSHLKRTVSIPLMWETWEFRKDDLDLEECRRLGIPVLGTDENHPHLQIHQYIGYVAVKLLNELNIEIFRSKIVVIGSGKFAETVVNLLKSLQAEVVPLNTLNTERGNVLRTEFAKNALKNADALVVVEHQNREMLIGPTGILNAEMLFKLNPGLSIAHICGGVDRHALVSLGLPCQPEQFAEPGYMSVTTAFVGPKPLIDLHTAGLKVGERLAFWMLQGKTAREAEELVLQECPYAQGFPG